MINSLKEKIEIFEDEGENTLCIDNKYADFTIDVYPESKTYRSRMCLKDDIYYRTEQFEYRIKTDPFQVETRLIKRMDEPPERYCVKDGIVLESDILADRKELASMSSMTKEFIDGLKKEVVWHKEWVDNISMYILSKHPEIISLEDYRRHLRHLSEKIKSATLKVKKALESDEIDFQITDEWIESGRTIWCSKSKQETMSEEEIKNAIEHKKKLRTKFFDEKSKEYVGISEDEFRSSIDILTNIETFLNKKSVSIKKEVGSKISKTKGVILSLLLTLFISWLVSLFVDINPFLIFVLVQIIALIQALLGGWIERKFLG